MTGSRDACTYLFGICLYVRLMPIYLAYAYLSCICLSILHMPIYPAYAYLSCICLSIWHIPIYPAYAMHTIMPIPRINDTSVQARIVTQCILGAIVRARATDY